MNITLLTVGKTDRNWIWEGLQTYCARLKHYMPFSVVEIPDLKNISALSKDQIKEKEGQLILKNLKDADEVILLDEKGKEYTSKEWALMLEKKISSGGRNIVLS